MRMRQYICHTDHNLWDVTVNEDLEEEPAPTRDQFGPSATLVPKTAKQLATKRNQERVKSILFLAIPDEYLLKFHNVADAKSLRAAIKARFGGCQKLIRSIGGSCASNNQRKIQPEVPKKPLQQPRIIEIRRKGLSSSTSTSQNFRISSIENTLALRMKSGRNQGRRSYGDNGRSNAQTNESSSQALVAQDGLGGYDWSNDFDEPVTYAIMAITSSSSSNSSDTEVQNYSKQCVGSFKSLQKKIDSEREKHNRARLEIQGYELALESLESRILRHEKNELA
ncbi:hypothetical protein Tco_1471185 [Tanacetum coccineum]